MIQVIRAQTSFGSQVQKADQACSAQIAPVRIVTVSISTPSATSR